MTNGAGGAHGQKREKAAAGRKGQRKEPKASAKRKGWIPAGLARGKNS
jgi:hypothetical protein